MVVVLVPGVVCLLRLRLTLLLTYLLTYLLTTYYLLLQRIVALETAMSMPPGAHSSGSWLVRIAALEAEANERLL